MNGIDDEGARDDGAVRDRSGDGWGTAAVWVLLGLMALGIVATAHSVWHTFLR